MAASLTIAVVDDDQSIREALGDFIMSCGYRCHLFVSAESFLAETPPVAADCVLADMTMPGIGGIGLQVALNARKTRPPIIFMTGGWDDRQRRAAVAGGAFAFLEKPVDIDILADCLEAALKG